MGPCGICGHYLKSHDNGDCINGDCKCTDFYPLPEYREAYWQLRTLRGPESNKLPGYP